MYVYTEHTVPINTKMSLNITPRRWHATESQESPKDSILLSGLDDDEFPSSTDIFRKKLESQSKFRTTWESIINKYSAYDEEDQGDLIDLRSGKLIEDKGHLRSLVETPAQSIWDKFFDDERERDRERRSQRVREDNKNEKDTLVVLTPKSKSQPHKFATPKSSPAHQDPLCILGLENNKVSELRRSFSQKLRMNNLPSSLSKGSHQMEPPRTPTRESNADPLIFLTPSVASTPRSSRRGTLCGSLAGSNSRPSTLKRLLVERKREVASTPTRRRRGEIEGELEEGHGRSGSESGSESEGDHDSDGDSDGDSSDDGELVTRNDRRISTTHDKRSLESTKKQEIEIIDLTSETEASEEESRDDEFRDDESRSDLRDTGSRARDTESRTRDIGPRAREIEYTEDNPTENIFRKESSRDPTTRTEVQNDTRQPVETESEDENSTQEIEVETTFGSSNLVDERTINTTKEIETSEDEYFSAAEKAVPIQHDTVTYREYLNRKKQACPSAGCRFKTTSDHAMAVHRMRNHHNDEVTDSSSEENNFSMKDSVISNFVRQVSSFPKLVPEPTTKRASPERNADRKRKTSAFIH